MSVTYQPAALPPVLTMMLALLDAADARRVAETFQFASAAHQGQLRDEGTPFIDHPIAVTSILWNELGCRDVDIIVTALAHDILEDCCIEPEALRTLLGDRAFALVESVTKQPVPEAEKPRRDDAYLQSLHTASDAVRLLKLADRIHNLRSVLLSADHAKAGRYLTVSRAEFLPLAVRTDPTAARLIEDACDAIELHLSGNPG